MRIMDTNGETFFISTDISLDIPDHFLITDSNLIVFSPII